MSTHSASPAPDDAGDNSESLPAMPDGSSAVPAAIHQMIAAPLPVMDYPQRKRVRLACSNCHRGKIKCDGERPCDRCLKKGLAPEECIDFQRKRTACTSCRAVKMKCDGNRPCKRCVKKGKGEECTDVDLPGVRAPRREHRLKHDDNVDDAHRPVPYNYEDAAAAAAAAAGYYYGAPPPWAYHPHAMPEGHWTPYAHVYPHPYAQPPAAGSEDEGRRGEYSATVRSSYPDMPVDPALDPELLRQGQQSGAASGSAPPEGWIRGANSGANGSYYENGENNDEDGDGEGDGEDGEQAGDGDGDDAEAPAEADTKEEEDD